MNQTLNYVVSDSEEYSSDEAIIFYDPQYELIATTSKIQPTENDVEEPIKFTELSANVFNIDEEPPIPLENPIEQPPDIQESTVDPSFDSAINVEGTLIDIPMNNIINVGEESTIDNTKNINDMINASITDKENQNVSEFVNPFGRSLRKRTAIQKMPYSLERIKHRQQLQGFDVSNFETVSNKVRLPALAEQHIHNDQEKQAHLENNDVIDDIPYIDDINDDSDFSDYVSEDDIVPGTMNPENSQHDTVSNMGNNMENDNMSNDTDIETQNITFRGRQINISTGYRGILPRSAWEKEMKKSEIQRGHHKRKRPPKIYHKGLAIKKKSKGNQNGQDDMLLSDIAIVNDEAVDDDNDISDYLIENRKDADANELNQLEQYYNDHYENDEYMSDIPRSSTLAENINATDHDIINIDSDGLMSDPDMYIMTDYDTDEDRAPIGMAIEDNRNIISAMSSKPSKKKKTIVNKDFKIQQQRQPPRRRTVYRRKRDKPKGGKRVLSRPIIRKITVEKAGSSKGNEGNSKRTKNDAEKVENQVEKENKKPRTYRRTANNNTSTSFVTVVEALGNKYSAITHKGSVTQHNLEVSKQAAVDRESLLPILDILIDNKIFDPPNVVNIDLGNKKFVLSRYSLSEVSTTTGKIFDTIVMEGASNTELMNTSRQLTEFFFHLNDMSLLIRVQQFHREFRERVYKVRERAKVIHFFEIALCQLFLVEIFHYTKTPNVTKEKIRSDIIRNTVSFFILLSECYSAVKKDDIMMLYQSYDILATIIDILDVKEDLWNKLDARKLPGQILHVITAIFPTRKSHWNALKIPSDYKGLVNAFWFIRYCIKVGKWNISDEIMLALNDIFKRRRFQDFEEENLVSEKNFVIGSPERKLPVATLFNKYLTILRSYTVTTAMSEKIMPISEVVITDNDSIIVNRMNLLTVLAGETKFNLDLRLKNLIKPLLIDETSSDVENITSDRRITSIFNSILAFLKINAIKKNPFRMKNIISQVYKSLIMNKEHAKQHWVTFLRSLDRNFEKIGRSKSLVLKDLYEPLHHYQTSACRDDESSTIIINMMVKNMKYLKMNWLQNTLLPLVSDKAKAAVEWIGYYCAIGKFLVDHKATTWWTFYTYQGLTSNKDIEIAFNYNILQLCDNNSFNTLNINFFLLATRFFLKEDTLLFKKFLAVLLKRDTSIQFDFFFKTLDNNLFSWVKIYFESLKKHKYNPQMEDVIEQIKKMFTEKAITTEMAFKVVSYLNEKYTDDIKNSHSFMILKRELNISDKFTEISIFRETFVSYKTIEDKIYFLENQIIDSLSTEEETLNLVDMLVTLLNLPFSENALKIFKEMIQQHLSIHIDSLKLLSGRIIVVLLRVINRSIKSKFYQADKSEIAELIELVNSMICQYVSVDCYDLKDEFIHIELLILIHSVLKITQGSDNWKMCIGVCRVYIYAHYHSNGIQNKVPERRIIELLEKQEDKTKLFWKEITSRTHERGELEDALRVVLAKDEDYI
ncbi:hypothetical protein C6P45_000245 [Maudiozyma exigua]|uniref:Methyl methanesulfonate-sensitivity protein 22 n=1 Tax=Maudiozyma exigua TaxID=34358 RepID=A0A9P6W7V3_MAUEX|nr:hypothetical protein C6P45_000245 [Kazachstania exigua]